MNAIIDTLHQTPAPILWLLAGLGAALAATGLGLIFASLMPPRHRPRDPHWRRASKLVPLLADETLCSDLRALYQQSLYLDALVDDLLPDARRPPTGTSLGRRTRQALLRVQALRYQGAPRDHHTVLLNNLRLHLEQAISLADSAQHTPAPSPSSLLASLQQLAQRIDLPSPPQPG